MYFRGISGVRKEKRRGRRMSEETYPAGPAVMQLREAGCVERRIGVISCLLFVYELYMNPVCFLYELFFFLHL